MYNRHSIRLPNFDYSSQNLYFVTICSKNKDYIFSQISSKGIINLTYLGSIVDIYLNKKYIGMEIQDYVIMPNHIHFIIEFNSYNKIALGNFIRTLKSKIAKEYNDFQQSHNNQIWQRNYYEHIIRNEFDLNRIKKYIKNNPYKWIYKN